MDETVREVVTLWLLQTLAGATALVAATVRVVPVLRALVPGTVENVDAASLEQYSDRRVIIAVSSVIARAYTMCFRMCPRRSCSSGRRGA